MSKQPSKPNRRRTLVELIEPRVLYSAGLDVVLIDGSLDDTEALVAAAHEADVVEIYDGAAESANDVLGRLLCRR